MGLLSAGYVATGICPALAVVFPEYVMGVLGAASIFSGSNVLEKWRKPT